MGKGSNSTDDLKATIAKEFGISDDDLKSPRPADSFVQERKIDEEKKSPIEALEDVLPGDGDSSIHVRDEILFSQYEDEVEDIRKAIFGDASPPCHTIDEMNAWLKRESEEVPDTGNNKLLREKIESISTISYTEDGNTKTLVIKEYTLLAELYGRANLLSKKLSVEVSEMVHYILTGFVSSQGPVSVDLHSAVLSTGQTVGKIIITIREPISDYELQNIYKVCRNALWGKNKGARKISERDKLLIFFVIGHVDLENPDWEDARREWHRNYPQYSFFTSREIRTAYQRAYSKFFPEVDL